MTRVDNPIRVLSGQGYVYDFATPRLSTSQFTVERTVTKSPRRIWQALWGLSFYDFAKSCDLFHAFNGIPLSKHRYVLSFESYIPRVLGGFASDRAKSFLARQLTYDRCRAVAALSKNALKISRRFNLEDRHWNSIEDKLTHVYPSVGNIAEAPAQKPQEMVLTFVGNDFGRKGGVACLLLSEKLNKIGLRHTLNIIGNRQFGIASYTDCNDAYYEKHIAAAGRNPSVQWLGKIANDKTLSIVSKSHFLLLPTLDDTFGYSVLESMAAGTPVMATAQRALLEVVDNGKNSICLPLELNDLDQWRHIGKGAAERSSRRYEQLVDDVHHAAADTMAQWVVKLNDDSAHYDRMAKAAIEQIRLNHDPLRQAKVWGDIYMKAVAS